MFEEALRAGETARWHLGLCGWSTYLKQERRPTASLDPRTLCLNCARGASNKLPREEASEPHGVVILKAAARHLFSPRRP